MKYCLASSSTYESCIFLFSKQHYLDRPLANNSRRIVIWKVGWREPPIFTWQLASTHGGCKTNQMYCEQQCELHSSLTKDTSLTWTAASDLWDLSPEPWVVFLIIRSHGNQHDIPRWHKGHWLAVWVVPTQPRGNCCSVTNSEYLSSFLRNISESYCFSSTGFGWERTFPMQMWLLGTSFHSSVTYSCIKRLSMDTSES